MKVKPDQLAADASGVEGGQAGRVTAVACAALLLAFGVVSWCAARGKCPTYDEPMHAVAVPVLTQYGDFRVDAPDPPLWQWWAGLALPRGMPRVNLASPAFRLSFQDSTAPWYFCLDTLYHTPGNDADRFVGRLRGMLILLGVAAGALTAWWSWRLGGAVAAVAATALFALDPSLLAHSAIVKNDVAIALATLATAYATWCAGRRLTVASAAGVCASAAAVLVTKFSGPVVIIALAATLAARAALPWPWRCFGRECRTRATRAGVAAGLLCAAAAVAYVTIWANYSFRFAPAPDGSRYDMAPFLLHGLRYEIVARNHPGVWEVTRDEEARAKPGAVIRAVDYLERHRALPQAWLWGTLCAYTNSLARQTYFWGQPRRVSVRGYFLYAFLFKEPIATLAAVIGAAVVGAAAVRSRLKAGGGDGVGASRGAAESAWWSCACIAIPLVVIGTADLRANVNIGIRHVLQLYPLIFIATGCAVAAVWRRVGRRGRGAIAALAVALAAETALAFPDYIPFFNVACGGARGGLRLLSDSNIDWGQDLPLLARWQREHPDRPLYLCYFGTADPSYYGIRFTPLPGSDFSTHPYGTEVKDFPTKPGVIAISATDLQGTYLTPRLRAVYSLLRDQPPLDVLGGSIYLYEYAP